MSLFTLKLCLKINVFVYRWGWAAESVTVLWIWQRKVWLVKIPECWRGSFNHMERGKLQSHGYAKALITWLRACCNHMGARRHPCDRSFLVLQRQSMPVYGIIHHVTIHAILALVSAAQYDHMHSTHARCNMCSRLSKKNATIHGSVHADGCRFVIKSNGVCSML